jgi:hypothetical protein
MKVSITDRIDYTENKMLLFEAKGKIGIRFEPIHDTHSVDGMVYNPVGLCKVSLNFVTGFKVTIFDFTQSSTLSEDPQNVVYSQIIPASQVITLDDSLFPDVTWKIGSRERAVKLSFNRIIEYKNLGDGNIVIMPTSKLDIFGEIEYNYGIVNE